MALVVGQYIDKHDGDRLDHQLTLVHQKGGRGNDEDKIQHLNFLKFSSD